MRPEARMLFPPHRRAQWRLLLLTVALACILIQGCSPLRLVNSVTPEGTGIVEKGIIYGPASRNMLDLYISPKAEQGRPLLVFFYGGSWRNGDRELYRFVGQSLSSKGYNVAIPDYRLYPEVHFPDFVKDGALALAWLRNNRPEANAGFVLVGHSAGAHTAALLTLNTDYLAEHDLSIDTIRGMIGIAGPYGFNPLQYRSTRSVFGDLQSPQPAQPTTFACSDPGKQPMLLLLHGAADSIVIPRNSKRLHDLLKTCGGNVEFTEYPDADHFDVLLGLSERFSYLAPVLSDIELFLRSIPERN